MSFISSFNFGGAEKVMDIIGVIDSAFNFGWDGNLDKISTNSDDNQTKTISIGYSFSSDDIDLSVKDAAEAQKDPALSADQKKEKRKKAAESAVDKNGTKNKSKAEVCPGHAEDLHTATYTVNVGGTYSIWKDHINLIAELNDGKYFIGGIFFKLHLK